MTNSFEAVYSDMAIEPLIRSSTPQVELAGERNMRRDAEVPSPQSTTCSDDSTRQTVPTANSIVLNPDLDMGAKGLNQVQGDPCLLNTLEISIPSMDSFRSSDERFWANPSMDVDNSSFEENCSPDIDNISMITFDYEEESLYERNILYRLLVDLGATIDCGLFLGWSDQNETRQNCMALERESD
mmetsp:Transcript_12641/g.22891  ORF Transcript_12641/g.22891 Transcript_12641/m.22891 type:complete len:185 (-) Transcript_12641:45-599(-)|eukprot:CAMPEP_0198290726 /NCGR_PEP_ID=MMETSP1449-20131203/8485_1 /TAXON_ID=420275 /ORGANISM="Attheya septentrionalis, Strain CCMP2084" /LENGTH=184 /DNA_ID=CAMNT_0043989267 /DNA_START=149 /DNA_END=703 /DNA_ORIENTATION=-